MADSRALIKRESGTDGNSFVQTLDDAVKLADIFAKSGLFKDTPDAAKAVVKIIAGQELGVPPMTAMRNISIVQGRVTIDAGLMAGLMRRAGYSWSMKLDDEGCWLTVSKNGQELGTASFTLQDAKRAGLIGKDNYRQYPQDMMFARALSRAARRFASEVLMGGVYVTGEIPEADKPGPSASPFDDNAIDVEASVVDVVEQRQETPARPRRWTDVDRENFKTMLLHEKLTPADTKRLCEMTGVSHLEQLGSPEEVIDLLKDMVPAQPAYDEEIPGHIGE